MIHPSRGEALVQGGNNLETPLKRHRVSMIRRFKVIGFVAALAAVYFAAGKFGLSLAFVHPNASVVWPASGIALAALLLWGYRLWPGVFLGAFATNATTEVSVATALEIGLGNTLEALLGAWLVNRFARGVKAFERAGDILRFVLLATVLSTAVSATVGATSLSLGGFALWDRYSVIWLTWWFGDMVGELLIVPLFIVWFKQEELPLKLNRILEGVALLLAVIVISQTIFLGRFPFGYIEYKGYPLAYLATLPLIWATFRFGQVGAVTSTFVVSTAALWGTLHGAGPFAFSTLLTASESLLMLQAFIGIMTITALLLAAAIAEREHAERLLQVQGAVDRVLADFPTLNQVAPRIVRALCERAGWEIGALWHLDRDANLLLCVDVWHDPSIDAAEFEAVTRRLTFAPGEGLIGRVWSSRTPLWVPDVTQEEHFLRPDEVRKLGLHTLMCFPITLGDRLLGVIECFSRRVRTRDEKFLVAVKDIGSRLGQFIERKEAEERLRESEARFQAIIDNSTAVIYLKDLEGKYRLTNVRYEELFDISKRDAIGKTDFDIFPEEVARGFQENDRRVLEAGVPVQCEEVAPHPDGPHTYISIKFPLADSNGKTYGVAGISTDITDRKRVEETLRRRTRSLEIINRVGNALSAELDIDRIVQMATDAGREICGAAFGAFFYNVKGEGGESYLLYTLSGVPREAFEKFPMPRNTAIFGPTFRGEGVVRIGDVLKDPRYGKNPPHHGMPKGHLPVRSYLAVPVVSRAEGVLGGLFFGHPEPNVFNSEAEGVITAIAAQAAVALDNANLYRAVQQRVEEFGKLIDIAPVGIAVAMDPACEYLWGNREFSHFLGIDPSENISQSSFVLAKLACKIFRNGKEVSAGDLPIQRACRENREILEEEFEVWTQDGRVFYVLGRATPLRDEQGRVRGGIGVFLNITERRRGEEALQQAKEELTRANEELEKRVQARTAELERAHAALLNEVEEQKRLEAQLRQSQKMESIGTLAGGIAHDFNNILNIIQGYASQIAESGTRDETTNESLQAIDEAVGRGSSVVRQLMMLARKTTAHLERSDINGVVSELARWLKQTFPKTIVVSSELDPALPATWADAGQITQALLNLCVNARDAMPGGGEIVLKTRTVSGREIQDRAEEAKAERYICAEVVDTGTGMEESVRTHVFEPFFTTKRIGEGTGLGLAIVYGVVKNHNGFIDVESKAGEGTAFRLYLPVVSLEEEPHREKKEKRESSRGQMDPRGTVLLAEDEEAMLRLLQRTLTQSGYRVLGARDGEEAVDLYSRHKKQVDVVLLDIGLPKLSGWDVIRRIRTENPDVSVIIASGYMGSELSSEMEQAGVKDFINKPYKPQEIIERLQSLIERS